MFEEFDAIPLIDYLAKAKQGSEVAVLVQIIGQLEDGTPVTIILPDDVMNNFAQLVAERVTMPGETPTITTVDLTDDDD